MTRRVAAALAIVALTAAAPEPSPPAGPPLPEIGRTKATRLPCAVLRDVVAPSVGAALDADAAFLNARTQVHQYGTVTGAIHPNDAAVTMAMMKLDRNLSAVAKDVRTIAKALGDGRVTPAQSDPDTRALRTALQTLYDVENEKLNSLSAFVEGDRMTQLLNDNEGMTDINRANAPAEIGGRPNAPRALSSPKPFSTTRPTPGPRNATGPESMPTVAAVIVADDTAQRRDPRSATAVLASREDQASRAIIAIANACR